MNIRSKLTWTYVILLIIGIITISTYAILSIRAYLLEEGIEELKTDVQTLGLSIAGLPAEGNFNNRIENLAASSGYDVALYDKSGIRLLAYPDSAFTTKSAYLDDYTLSSVSEGENRTMVINDAESEKLVAITRLESSENATGFLQISQLRNQYYAATQTIRHIIYAGMFFSIGAVIIISFMFARYMAGPILYLNEAALDIATGNVDREINLKRTDEFGTLANSINKMASTLKKDNEQLKKLNERTQQFFADITHEIRNPLHSIAAALEMLEIENLPDEKRKKYLSTARRQTMRIERLFKDIKTLQRYDLDENFINKKSFDIGELLKEVAESHQHVAEKKGIDFRVSCNSKRKVYADPDKIEQVLDNLISNAVKYTNEGKIEVDCDTKGNMAYISITDTGIGIDEEHLDRLFDRFYRTDKARSRNIGGTGLGLSIVKSILNAHGEDIHIKSEKGKGSRFFFYLPFSK